MNKYKYLITIFLFLSLIMAFPLYSQDTGGESDESVVIETPTEEDLLATDETIEEDASVSDEEPIPEEVIPEEVTPDEVTPDEVTPDEVTPDEVTPDEVTPDEVTPDEVTPDEVTPDEVTPDEVTPDEGGNKKSGKLHFFLDNKLLFAFSVPDGGFGFGETANIQYILPFNLAFGLESGYYGFRGGIEEEGVSIVAGYTMIPIYATAAFNIPIVENFYITPVLKGGMAYTNARINGWMGGDSFSGIFEGGVRFKAYMRGGFLIHGGIMYTGLIEKSGLFSIMSIGFGFGL